MIFKGGGEVRTACPSFGSTRAYAGWEIISLHLTFTGSKDIEDVDDCGSICDVIDAVRAY